jgi:hypothetical protein
MFAHRLPFVHGGAVAANSAPTIFPQPSQIANVAVDA